MPLLFSHEFLKIILLLVVNKGDIIDEIVSKQIIYAIKDIYTPLIINK